MLTVVEMPLNYYGEGPETNPELVDKTVYEVWNEENVVIATFPIRSEAEYFVKVYR